MLSESEFKQEARRRGVRTDFVEKDYVNSWVLYAIYKEFTDVPIVFKGGTALSKLYQNELRRFSEDLDFTLKQRPSKDFVQELLSSLQAIERKSHISFELRASNRSEGNKAIPGGNIGLRIKYTTPPFNHENTTAVDLDWGTTIQFPPRTHTIDEQWTDIPSFDVTAYSIQEILAEKTRCLFMRPKTRDIYDVHRILNEQDIERTEISSAVKSKLDEYKVDADIRNGFPKRLENETKENWEEDLKSLIYGDLPSFSTARQQINTYLERLGRQG